MSKEVLKNSIRRSLDKTYDFLNSGKGLDIGAGVSPINQRAQVYDKDQGDALYVDGLDPESFDWVHSSHCLEHLTNPLLAVQTWWSLIKPGGHLLITVPDFFLYEKKIWPSKFNKDHKNKFTILWYGTTINLLSLFNDLENCQIKSLRINDDYFNYGDRTSDQTLGQAQAEIEILVYKHHDNFWTSID